MPRTLPLNPGRLLEGKKNQTSGTVVCMQELQPAQNWTPFLYAPQAYTELLTHAAMTPLASLAQVRIGFQSFAKMFYIISREVQQRWELEHRWLRPLIMSPKDVDIPILSAETPIRHYILACDWPKQRLLGAQLLRYIQYWESQVLSPRGRARPVVGVHQLPRVRKTRRSPWYNLLVDLNRRGTTPILLPRRIYRRYQVVWNQIGWVAGENFIEITPMSGVPLSPLLAILNAGTTEIAIRASAHVYGGGVYNLSPGSIGEVPVVDVRRLSTPARHRLEGAYRQFLLAGGKDRTALDLAVLESIGLPAAFLHTLRTALDRMQGLSNAVVEPVTMDPADGKAWPEELRLL